LIRIIFKLIYKSLDEAHVKVSAGTAWEKSMSNLILRLLPSPVIRAAGRLQFKIPALRKLINLVGHGLAGEGVIQRGAGKGLFFNARGCNPGYLAGTTEPLEQEILLKYSTLGGVFYDVGGNAGFHAMIAARAVGPTGCVYAFEPTPTLAARIRDNAARNSFKNVHVVEAAISQIDGQISFHVLGPLSLLNSVRTDAAAETVSVNSIRLNTFSADHRPPDLLLIDVEGSEIEVLESGLEMITRHRPVIMVEVHYLGQTFIDFVHRTLLPLRYTAATYQGGPLVVENKRYHALLVPLCPA
jgi:FkbM family methyltransferase